MIMQRISFATRTLLNAVLNGNRGYQAPWTGDDKSRSLEAKATLKAGGPAVLKNAPAAAISVQGVPQAYDFVHAAAQSRMLPAFSPESTSGGWVALSYAFDPPPAIPDILIPAATWSVFLGETNLTGLQSAPTAVGAIYALAGLPEPGIGYPAAIEGM